MKKIHLQTPVKRGCLYSEAVALETISTSSVPSKNLVSSLYLIFGGFDEGQGCLQWLDE